MSILAILVADIFATAADVLEEMERDMQFNDINCCKTRSNAISKNTSTRPESHSTEGTNKKQKSEETRQRSLNPKAREVVARSVASWSGKVQKLDYPWTRVVYKYLLADEQEQWEEDMDH
jgi:hypothetical protein